LEEHWYSLEQVPTTSNKSVYGLIAVRGAVLFYLKNLESCISLNKEVIDNLVLCLWLTCESFTECTFASKIDLVLFLTFFRVLLKVLNPYNYRNCHLLEMQLN
jgi:hypothetical protein